MFERRPWRRATASRPAREPRPNESAAVTQSAYAVAAMGRSESQSEQRPILITGTTGFVGMEVLARFLQGSQRHIFALIRAGSDAEAHERLRTVLATTFGDPDAYPGRVTAVAGDIEQPGLGFEPGRLDELAEQVSRVLHAAASVSFDLGIAESRGINLGGTQHMLAFATRAQQLGGLQRFTYVSTAYVAGTHRGDFSEQDYNLGQGFRNSYERSKWESEGIVRAASSHLPVQIARPSIIVGEQATGWTVAFNVLYGPVRALSQGAYRALPLNLKAPVDVVPIDYVAAALFELCSAGPNGTFHLVAGDRATTVGRLVQLTDERFRQQQPRIVRPVVYRALYPLLRLIVHGRQRLALEHTQVFIPYLNIGVHFKDRVTRARLEPAGVRVLPVEDYFLRLLDFAVAARWGKQPLPHPRGAADVAPHEPPARVDAGGPTGNLTPGVPS
jgi:thioester reductase-like protein